jgi:uncharacterized short protein YbdD (DUF466 family)
MDTLRYILGMPPVSRYVYQPKRKQPNQEVMSAAEAKRQRKNAKRLADAKWG